MKAASNSMRMPLSPLLSFQAKARDADTRKRFAPIILHPASMPAPVLLRASFQRRKNADILVGITRSIPIVFADYTAWYVTFVFLQEITIYANSFY